MDLVFAVNNGVYFNFNNKTNKCHNYIDSQRDEREREKLGGYSAGTHCVFASGTVVSNVRMAIWIISLICWPDGLRLGCSCQQFDNKVRKSIGAVAGASSLCPASTCVFLYVSIVVVVVAAIESTCALRYYRPFR